MIKLIIIDDHPIFRRGLREIIEEKQEFKIVGEASDGKEGLKLIAKCNPDIVVMDVDMPNMNGLELARALRKDRSPIKVVILTMYNDEDLYNEAMDNSVMGYVLKENASEELIAALVAVSSNKEYSSTGIAKIGKRRKDRVQSMLLSTPQLDLLTPAERRILKLISEDHTSKEIAEVLKISVKTVENHRLNICNKLEIHGSHSLLKFAFDHKSHL
jgi:DNA-binding NarL/FixJ family response regulator